MSENRFRLMLTGIMAMTLFLPWHPGSQGLPNCLFILWHSGSAIAWIFTESRFVSYTTNLAGWLNVFSLLSLLSVPILIPLNVFLAVSSSRKLATLYRILVLILLPLTWHFAFHIDPVLRGIGFWANLVVVTASVLLEIVFVARERFRKLEDAGQETL